MCVGTYICKKKEEKRNRTKGRKEGKKFLVRRFSYEEAKGEDDPARRFRNRIIYSRRGAILGRAIVKPEARLMDPSVLGPVEAVDCFG